MRVPDGWQGYDTGGGCYAWRREWPGGQYALITQADGEGEPQTETVPVLLGFYDAEGSPTVLFRCVNYHGALLIAGQVEQVGE